MQPIPEWLTHPLSSRLYGDAFIHWAKFERAPGEFLLDASPAISKTVATKVSRKDREGTLGLTQMRVVFVSMKSGTLHHSIDLHLIARLSWEGRRNVMIDIKVGSATTSIMIGRDQAERIIPVLSDAMKRAQNP